LPAGTRLREEDLDSVSQEIKHSKERVDEYMRRIVGHFLEVNEKQAEERIKSKDASENERT